VSAVGAVEAPEVSSTLRTMDVWFDNMFSDWMVGDRIRASAESVRNAQEQVSKIQTEGAARRQQVATRHSELEQEYLVTVSGE
jgi:hypothetical protein